MSERQTEYTTDDARNEAIKKIGAEAESHLPMWVSGLNNGAKVITTTQPINCVTHERHTAVPTLRDYLLEQERDMLRKLQRIRDLLAQLPRD
jgi:hypothetical protein